MRLLLLLPALVVLVGCTDPKAVPPTATLKAHEADERFADAEIEEVTFRCQVKGVQMVLLPEIKNLALIYRYERLGHIPDASHLFCGVDANWQVDVEVLSHVRDTLLDGVRTLQLHVHSPAKLFETGEPRGKQFWLTLRRYKNRQNLLWFTIRRTSASLAGPPASTRQP